MVIWLRHAQAAGAQVPAGAGIDGDIVRADALATLVDVGHAYDETNRRCASLLAEAQQQAQAIIDAAHGEAQTLLEQAQNEYRDGMQRGYDDAWQQAIADAHARHIALQADEAAMGQAKRQRLADIVALGVEQVVGGTDAEARLRHAARAVDGIVADGSPIKICVHPGDLSAATQSFNEAAREWRAAGRAVRLQISGDANVEAGYCVCETDLGAIDLSLSLQLAAVRTALSGALVDLPHDDAPYREASVFDESVRLYDDHTAAPIAG